MFAGLRCSFEPANRGRDETLKCRNSACWCTTTDLIRLYRLLHLSLSAFHPGQLWTWSDFSWCFSYMFKGTQNLRHWVSVSVRTTIRSLTGRRITVTGFCRLTWPTSQEPSSMHLYCQAALSLLFWSSVKSFKVVFFCQPSSDQELLDSTAMRRCPWLFKDMIFISQSMHSWLTM